MVIHNSSRSFAGICMEFSQIRNVVPFGIAGSRFGDRLVLFNLHLLPLVQMFDFKGLGRH
jgi:hypothetical protein